MRGALGTDLRGHSLSGANVVLRGPRRECLLTFCTPGAWLASLLSHPGLALMGPVDPSLWWAGCMVLGILDLHMCSPFGT